MTDASDSRPDLILTHMDWVRRLAHQLARDPHVADELVQATCVAAIERPPGDASNLRGWFARTLRNALKQLRRQDRRYRAHLSKLDETRAPVPPDELVSRAQVQRRVADAALELPEPYRGAILLRYFEGMTPAQIATHLRAPVATVKSRLSRALAMLRQRLDEQHGGRERWLVALLPLQPICTAAMKTKVTIAAAACVLATIPIAWYAFDESSEADGAAPGRVVAARSAVPAARPDRDEAGQPLERQAVDDTIAFLAALAEPVAGRASFRGRVLGMDGRPRAGVHVGLAGDIESRRASSDADGWFELERPLEVATLRATDPGLTTVVAARAHPSAPQGAAGRPVLVVAPTMRVGGTVSDGLGAPLDGVEIRYELPADFRTRFEDVLDFSLVERFSALASDEHGRFTTPPWPIAAGAVLQFRRSGFVSQQSELPRDGDSPMHVVLRRPSGAEQVLAGVVRAADGTPAPGARVVFGQASTTTDARGEFTLLRADVPSAGDVFALRAGQLPAHVELAELPAPGTRVLLTLGGDPARISGRVVDADGEPVRGALVWPCAPTFCGMVDGRIVTAEAVVGGTREPDWGFTATDERGAFELRGLWDKDYTVAAMHPGSMQLVEMPRVPAGTDELRIVLPADGTFRRVAGMVIGPNGQPLAGVRVWTCRDTITFEIGPGRSSSNRNCSGATVTDAEGRFELRGVASEGVYLFISGNGVMETYFGAAEGGLALASPRPVDDLQIVVRLKMELRVECDPAFADAFGAVDDAGRFVSLFHQRHEDSIARGLRFAIRDGRSRTASVPDSACRVVFFRGDREVGRRDLNLLPGRLNVVRP